MPIVIQELLASDTLSQAVDKINFNFDQLLLNGGGPVGPAGTPGPTGPVGGRGLKGATWYTGNSNPNTLILIGINDGDYFLQSNGQVWEYNGSLWVLTTVNLSGPVGPPGTSDGFNYVGGYNGSSSPSSINNENVAFVVPMPSGVSGGANQLTNEGISTVLLGAVGSTAIPPAGISFTNAFKIPDIMAVQLDSSLVSVLVHQKDSTASAIRFMGGGASIGDKYEQNILNNLSTIKLGIDDSLDFIIPKAATSPNSASDLIGLNFNTLRKGQQFYAGKQISIISGADPVYSGTIDEYSDITMIINTSNPSIPAKLSVSTTLSSASSLFEIGGNISIPNSTIKTGIALIETGNIGLIAKDSVKIKTSISHGIEITPGGSSILGSTGAIQLLTINSQDINLNSDNGIYLTAVGLINLSAPSNIITGGSFTHILNVDNTSDINGGTKIQGNLLWDPGSLLSSPFITTHRAISISKGNLSAYSSPVYLGNPNLTGSIELMANIFKGNPSSPVQYNRLYTTGSVVRNTLSSTSGIQGFVGHTVENTATGMTASLVGLRVRGVDRSGGTSGVRTKFHAMEDTTSVHNRMQYVVKTLTIDPFYDGITTGTGYTIPSTAMDATYLDIFIGRSSASTTPPSPDLGAADDDWDLYIPDGTYVGQRLIIHVIAIGGQTWDGTANRNWPAGSSGNIDIKISSGEAGSSYNYKQIGRLGVLKGLIGSVGGSEATFELLWVGRTYSAYDWNGSGSPIAKRRTSGWILTNGVGITTDTTGVYRAVESSQGWSN